MLKVLTTNRFEKDYKLMQKRGKNIELLDDIMRKLTQEESLDRKYKDHTLKGDYKARRECHIQPDWLLIYKIDAKEKTIIFVRTFRFSGNRFNSIQS
jgi:mRNA interferase YafQ